MKTISKEGKSIGRKISTIFVIFIISIMSAVLLISSFCGFYYLYRRNSIISIEQKVNNMEQEIEMLKSCVRWELILVESLSLQERMELDAIEESLRQRIRGAFRGKGCTALKYRE